MQLLRGINRNDIFIAHEFITCWAGRYSVACISLETGPPPSGQLNAGVRKEEGLARRPCRVRTQECGHLQFEAVRAHTPTVNGGLAVNMASLIILQSVRALHSLCKVQQEVIQRRDSFGGVRGPISCWRAVALNLTATRKSKHRRVATALRRYTVSCVGTSNFYERRFTSVLTLFKYKVGYRHNESRWSLKQKRIFR